MNKLVRFFKELLVSSIFGALYGYVLFQYIFIGG
nr:MAG TPA: hypothetical protein [Caudoviricetes sp.]DAY68223.1 MAG TPA: hypothetical protein [Caudoviricetes sp.]